MPHVISTYPYRSYYTFAHRNNGMQYNIYSLKQWSLFWINFLLNIKANQGIYCAFPTSAPKYCYCSVFDSKPASKFVGFSWQLTEEAKFESPDPHPQIEMIHFLDSEHSLSTSYVRGSTDDLSSCSRGLQSQELV